MKMAIKDVPIDVTKPENYIVNGRRVVRFRIGENKSLPLLAEFEIEPGQFTCATFTEDGFYRPTKITNENDLVEINSPQETKKRKVVQFSTCIYEDAVDGYAVTDDGLIFVIDMLFMEKGWKKLSAPEIPQD
jgi:hypothetical protein